MNKLKNLPIGTAWNVSSGLHMNIMTSQKSEILIFGLFKMTSFEAALLQAVLEDENEAIAMHGLYNYCP